MVIFETRDDEATLISLIVLLAIVFLVLSVFVFVCFVGPRRGYKREKQSVIPYKNLSTVEKIILRWLPSGFLLILAVLFSYSFVQNLSYSLKEYSEDFETAKGQISVKITDEYYPRYSDELRYITQTYVDGQWIGEAEYTKEQIDYFQQQPSVCVYYFEIGHVVQICRIVSLEENTGG